MLSEQITYYDVSDAQLPQDIADMFVEQAIFGKATKGYELITQSNPFSDVYYIKSGAVEISILSPNSKKYVFREMKAGSIIGELSAIDGEKRSVTVTTSTDITYYKMNRNKFFTFIEKHPNFGCWLMKSLVKRIRNITEQVFELTSLTVKCRILLDLIRRSTESEIANDRASFTWPRDQTKIASSLGTHREAVSREYSAFLKEGLIERSGEHLIVPSVHRLEKTLSRMMNF